MSYGGQPRNPDSRDLPPGWIEQYDAKFYVNTREDPPRPSWVHPLGPPSSSPHHYAAPSGPPPPDRRSASPYSPSGYNPPVRYGQGPPPPQQRYDSYTPQYGGPSPGRSPGPGPVSPYGSRPPVQQQDEQRGARPARSIMASGQPSPQVRLCLRAIRPCISCGAGLLGGFLLTEGIEKFEHHEQEVGFERGEQMGFGQGENMGFNQGEQVGGAGWF
ncbi:hypothetical protein BKA93DRAFT_820591 [Sparassis latifolia]